MHVDDRPGDRLSQCHGTMIPVGLTFKKEGNEKVGELMLIHVCEKCGKISINRLAGDDDVEKIQEIFEDSLGLDEGLKRKIAEANIYVAEEKDKEEVRTQLVGKD